MSTSHSISHATLFWWWLEQRSLPSCWACHEKYQLNSVLQSTTPYYKVLHSTTPYYKVRLHTTKYDSVLLYSSVLQNTTPYYKVLPVTNPFDSRNTWNVMYIARSNRSHLQHHQIPHLPRKVGLQNWQKMAETSFTVRARSDHDPSMIRPWTRQSATRPTTEVNFGAFHMHFVLKNKTFRVPAIFPNSAPVTKT